MFQLKSLKSNVKYTLVCSLKICFYNSFLKVLNKKLSELQSWSSKTILNNTVCIFYCNTVKNRTYEYYVKLIIQLGILKVNITYFPHEIVNDCDIHVSGKKNFISQLLHYTLSKKNILVLDNLALMNHYKKNWMNRKVFDKKSNSKQPAKTLRCIMCSSQRWFGNWMDTIKVEHLQFIGEKAPAVQPIPITMCLDLTKIQSK